MTLPPQDEGSTWRLLMTAGPTLEPVPNELMGLVRHCLGSQLLHSHAAEGKILGQPGTFLGVLLVVGGFGDLLA